MIQPGFRERMRLAVLDERLGRALEKTTSHLVRKRDEAFAQLEDSDRQRDLARAAKLRALAHLDENLAAFAARCRENGIVVHAARTAGDAAELIAGLAEGRGSVIKSKSMATEEVNLNDLLEARGVHVVETDLGEWAVQLAREKPSHIVVPALHKTKEQFAELIGLKVGETLPADPAGLVTVARRALRREFIAAGVGISGVNMGIAETGTIVLVTNEGNGRLVTSGPPLHIALMGIEKVVETLADATQILRVLARAGSGQKLTTYTSFISGPRRPGDPDGPEEVHLILLDNGRTEYLASELWESLLCIRCGVCLSACPVYQKVGGHAYASTYPGPIGLLATHMVRPDEKEALVDGPHASTLCGACLEACPLRIDIPRMLIALRKKGVEEKKVPLAERAFAAGYAALATRPLAWRLALAASGKAASLVGRDGFLPSLPSLLGRWTGVRDLPAPPSTPFRAWFAGRHG